MKNELTVQPLDRRYKRTSSKFLMAYPSVIKALNCVDDSLKSLNVEWYIGGSVGLIITGHLEERKGDLDIVVLSTDFKSVVTHLIESKNDTLYIVTDEEASADEEGHASFVYEKGDTSVNICVMSFDPLDDSRYPFYEAKGYEGIRKTEKWFKVANPVYALMAKTRYIFNDLEKEPNKFNESTIKRINKHLSDLTCILTDRFNTRLTDISNYEI